ncbi:MAG: hypothetical protein WBB98_01070 [Xanthobacteraceae bacterium]
MTKKEHETLAMLAMLISSGVVARERKQVRVATEALCNELGVPLPAEWTLKD